MSRISESNRMSWILQLCSLEANYKSQGWPKLWGVTQPNLNFWVSGHPQWLHHWLYICYIQLVMIGAQSMYQNLKWVSE